MPSSRCLKGGVKVMAVFSPDKGADKSQDMRLVE